MNTQKNGLGLGTLLVLSSLVAIFSSLVAAVLQNDPTNKIIFLFAGGISSFIATCIFLLWVWEKHLRRLERIGIARRKMMEHLLENVPIKDALGHLVEKKILYLTTSGTYYYVEDKAFKYLDLDQIARLYGMVVNHNNDVLPYEFFDSLWENLNWDHEKFQEFVNQASKKHPHVREIMEGAWETDLEQKKKEEHKHIIEQEILRGKKTL